MRKGTQGFTLPEVIIVVSIISILAGVVIFNSIAASQRSRDFDRQADLRTMQAAIELYKQRYGRYPAGCNGPGNWSGHSSGYACSGGDTQYIVGLAPEFISVLPTDKKLNGASSGYVYKTNSVGTVYKLAVLRTVETEIVDYSHPFKSCDASAAGTGICDVVGTGRPSQCTEGNAIFQSSYAVWGGYASGADAAAIEAATEDIVCD